MDIHDDDNADPSDDTTAADPTTPVPNVNTARGRDRVRTVWMDRIDPPVYDLRAKRSLETITALAEDIGRGALLQHPGVIRLANDRYRLVFGYTRFLAVQQLGLKKIDVTLVECANESEEILAGLRENLARSDLSDAEFARAITTLRGRGMQGQQIAAQLKIGSTKVSRLSRSLRHPVLGPRALADELSWGEAAEMLNVPSATLGTLVQEVIERRNAGKPMNIVEELRPRVQELRGRQKPIQTSAERLSKIRELAEALLSENPSLDAASLGELRLLSDLLVGVLMRHQ